MSKFLVTIKLLSIAGCVLFSSCASERKVTYSKAEATGLDKYQSNVKFETGKDGQAQWQNSKRSSFESQSGFAATKDFKGKSYDKNGYQKKKWGQNKDFSTKAYAGNTDGGKYKKVPHFANKASNVRDQKSNFGGQDYGTTNYNGATKKASKGRLFSKKEDLKTNIRRRVYKAPEIQSSQEYNGLSLGESKSLLGR